MTGEELKALEKLILGGNPKNALQQFPIGSELNTSYKDYICCLKILRILNKCNHQKSWIIFETISYYSYITAYIL